MSVGGLFLCCAFVLFFLEGLGMKVIPGVDAFAHASLVLGILLGGLPFVLWRAP